MKFVVIGYGFVGKAVYSVLSKKYEVYTIDPKVSNSKVEDTDADGFIICVPTPESDNKRCDDSLVTLYIEEIEKYQPDAHILIKSTTSVETLMQINNPKVTFSPEFLRGTTGADPTAEFANTDFMIFGGQDGRWWYEVFSQCMNLNNVRFIDLASAGFLKYTENAFLATKVIFFNELKTLYDNTIGCNYDAMIEALALDKRIGLSHTQVPGPDGQYGFGGHCLPKDTAEFVEWAKQEDNRLYVLETVRELNFLKYRKMDK